MNGRIYDFNVGRFLSVDPLLQFPENSQSANPYSYILNNPMSGTDPSGYSTVRSGNASAWSVASCDSNHGNTCANTPVDKIMAQWGLSNGQSNASMAKQSQQRREQARKDKSEASSASGDIDVSIDNERLNEVTQTKLSSGEIKNRQQKARELIKGVMFTNMAGQNAFGKRKELFTNLNEIASTDQLYELAQLYDGNGIHIDLCTKCTSQSQNRDSQGVTIIRLNVSEKVYSRAEGDNSYVSITGSRLLAHELAHAFKNHKTGSTLQNLTNESAASKYENIIMKQTGSSNVGVRAAYEGIENLPAGARILR